MADNYHCPYRGKDAEKCLHRRVKRRKVTFRLLPKLIYVCRDPDRVARGERCYNRPSVKSCEGYKTRNAQRKTGS